MTDDPNTRGAPDRSRIDVNEDREVRFWMKELEVSEEELKRLVAEHGQSAEAVRQAASRPE